MKPKQISPTKLAKPLFLERMQKILSDKKDFQNYLDSLKTESLKSIRCNTLKISPQELKKRLEQKNWKVSQPFSDYPEIIIINGKFAHAPNGLLEIKNINDKKLAEQKIFPSKQLSINNQKNNRAKQDNLTNLEPGEIGNSLEHQLGYYYVQDISSMMPILALNLKPDETFIDLCASPGSKTTQASTKMQNKGLILANEVSFGRIKILSSNLQRCGVSNTIIIKHDGVALCKRLKKQNFTADKILLDAPCSGEGTLKNSIKTYKMWNIKTIKSLAKLQKLLLCSAIEILKPQGEIIYSTCTHAPEENEEVLNFTLEKFKGKIKIEKINFPLKYREGLVKWEDKKYSKELRKSCRIYPQDNNTEGFFIAKLKKVK